MPTDPSTAARDIVDELASLDEAFAQDRDLAIRVVETMLASRPEASLRPGFRQELRARLLSAVSAQVRRTAGPSGLSRLRSFFVGSGVGTAVWAVAAYAFLVFVAPVSPDIVAPPVPQDDRSVRMISPAADDAALSMTSMLTGASAVSESAAADTSVVADTEAISADVAVPEPALERPASRPQSGGGSDPVSTPAAEPVSNSVRNSVSDTASTSQRVVAPESTQPSRPLAADKAMTAPISDDAFSLSDIFSPIPTESASSSSIMADSVPVSSSAVAPDPANYTVEISSWAVASIAGLPASPRSYSSESAAVAVPRSLSPAFSSSSRLSLRYMTASDDSPYGLSYSVDTVGGSIFASKNDVAWPAAAPVTEIVSDERILALTDAVVRPIRAGVIRFGSGAVLADAVPSDTVTVRYPVAAEGVDVYESYGVPREATVSYDRPAGRISGFSLPRVTGFSRTADAYSPPGIEVLESRIRQELAARGYGAGRYRVESARYVLTPEPISNPGVGAGKETLVPSVLLEVVSDAGIRESFVMPFGK